MKKFLATFFYLLDTEDTKGFIKFIFVLILGGLISLLGIASIVPFVNILLDPEKVQHFPFVKSIPYIYALGASIATLILAFWLRTIAGVVILKKQSTFLFGLTNKIRNKLFRNYLAAPYVYHLTKNSSTLISAVSTDVEVVSNRIFSASGIFLNEIITSSIVFIALLFIAPTLILGVGITLFLASRIYMQLLRKKAQKAGTERTENYSNLTRCITQSLGSLKETKLYHKENVFIRYAALFSKKIGASGTFETTFSQGIRFFLESVAITSVLLILFVYILLGYSGSEIFLLLSVFGVAAVQLLPSMNRMMQALATIQCALPSLVKIHDELKNACFYSTSDEKASKKNETPVSFQHCIQLKNLAFSYGNKKVLNQISLDILKGQKIALVGESGAGKTTVADIILGLLQPSEGEIFVDDLLLTASNRISWQNLLGYIPQMIYLYDSDIRQNVAFGVPENEIDDDQVRRCLAMASLTSFINGLPDNIHTRVGENGVQLSGGQRQRIGIARSLYRNPEILVMDEATAALDNKTEAEVTQALTVAGEGRTIITIAHRMSTIMHYDVIYYLKNGTIIAQGSYQDLIDKSEAFKQFVESSATGH